MLFVREAVEMTPENVSIWQPGDEQLLRDRNDLAVYTTSVVQGDVNQTKALRTHIAHAMKYFLTNFLVTLSAYGLISFAYPGASAAIPRICLMWAAPILGTLAAVLVTRVSLLGCALIAEALAMYMVAGIYSVVYHEKTILDTLHYVTIAYFLPGAILALLFGIFAKAIITWRLPRNTPQKE